MNEEKSHITSQWKSFWVGVVIVVGGGNGEMMMMTNFNEISLHSFCSFTFGCEFGAMQQKFDTNVRYFFFRVFNDTTAHRTDSH